MRPPLLFVSPRFLFPADEGGKIRTSNILRQMKTGPFEIILASPAPPDLNRYQDELHDVCDRFLSWSAVPASTLRRVRALLDRRPVSVATDDTEGGRAVVARALADMPDLVVIDFPHAAVLAPHPFLMPSVMFTHNVEAEIYERHARVAAGLMRLLWRNQARKMQRFEGETLRRFSRVIAVSKRDASALEQRFGLAAVDAIDTGVDLAFFTPEPAASPPQPDAGLVVFTGVMDSPANVAGIRYLSDKIWPLVLRKRPAARALIVGRNPSAALKAAAPASFTFTGTVDDIRPHVAKGHVVVIPLNVGSGTRIKAFEAMAMGRPIVSTSVGIEGLEVEHDEHLLLADSAPDFASAILKLLADPDLSDRLAKNARRLVEARFSWAQVARQFEQVCSTAIEQATGSRRPDGTRES